MSENPRLTFIGKLVVFLFIGACAYCAYAMFAGKPLGSSNAGLVTGSGARLENGKGIEIGIAYGTEKQRWLTWATEQFASSKEGRGIKVNLIPLGSVEAAQAVLGGDSRINVWSPASGAYKDVFVREWNLNHNKQPVLREESLALTPMVFVMWAERYEAFLKKYSEVSFKTIGEALGEPGGWNAIAKRPEWGVFKFGHTHPNQSNSGLMTLLLMADDYHKKNRGLALKDILDPAFQTWMLSIEKAVTGLSNSTGNMMRDMVLRGPSSYDALFVYENVAIDYLKNAEGRWGELKIIYPTQNIWNDNPYYILDTPWSGPQQRAAADEFLNFLLSEPIQKESLKHGFRPANPAIPIKFSESPFVLYGKFGLQVDIASTSESPSADVINNLLVIWQRSAR
ncbi:MAG: hypothetical protein JWL59_2145 [Chthoniobacteraceae bacterium]|nr:hypothetical protein [Chthoniobacteraceae bacterium]